MDQMIILFREGNSSNVHPENGNSENEEGLPVITASLASAVVKVLGRLCGERGVDGIWGQRMRELVGACGERWGDDFITKARSHPKLEPML